MAILPITTQNQNVHLMFMKNLAIMLVSHTLISDVVVVIQRENAILRVIEMNSEKILVNGSLMDRKYFEKNLGEARGYEWEQVSIDTIMEHGHCIICMMALPNNQSKVVYISKNVFLCTYCFEQLIKK